MHALVHSAGIQDRDGGVWVMATLFGLYPFLLKLYADGGYQSPRFQAGHRRACRQVDVEIVKRSDPIRSGQCRHGEGLHRPTQTLDRGANLRLAEPLPPPRQGLGMPQLKGPGLPPLGLRPTHNPEAPPDRKMIRTDS